MRQAIEAYNPDLVETMDTSELLKLVSGRVKEAIEDTVQTRKRINKTLESMGVRGV